MVMMTETRMQRVRRFFREITFEQVKVHLVLLSVQLVFSVFYILGKVALKSMHPFVFLTYRLGMATPILWIFAAVTSFDQIRVLPKGKKEWGILAGVGLLAVTINQSLFLVGLELSTASNAAITQPTISIISTLIGVVMGYEKKSPLKFVGILVAVLGAILMIDFTHLIGEKSGLYILLGNLCFLGNTAAYAGFLVLQQPLLKAGMSPAKVMAWAFTFGTIPVVAIALGVAPFSEFKETSWVNWLVLAYTAIAATAYTFWASSWAVKKSDPTTVAVYLTVEPLATSIMAAIFLHERLTLLNIAGAITILLGLSLVMISKHKERKEAAMEEYTQRKLINQQMEEESMRRNHQNPFSLGGGNGADNGSGEYSGESVPKGKLPYEIIDSSSIYISPDSSLQNTTNQPSYNNDSISSAIGRKMTNSGSRRNSHYSNVEIPLQQQHGNSILNDYDDNNSDDGYDDDDDENEMGILR